MTKEEERKIIYECSTSGDWTKYGDIITRDMLMDYLLYYTNPIIKDDKVLTKVDKIYCPLCGKAVKPYSVTLTHRAVKYLLCAIYLSKQSIEKGGDGYVHHELVHDLCQGKYSYDKGKRIGKGVSFTSYGTLMSEPWDFLMPKVNTKDKVQRDGTFIPTQKCYDFLHGKIGVPSRCEFLDSNVVRQSRKIVYAATVPNCNWQNTINIFKTF